MQSTPVFHVGQLLYWVNYERRMGPPSEVAIVKVGRRWLTLSNHKRVDRETLIEDSDAPGLCYLSKAAHDAVEERQQAWSELKRRLWDSHNIPPDLSAQDIRRAMNLLFPQG